MNAPFDTEDCPPLEVTHEVTEWPNLSALFTSAPPADELSEFEWDLLEAKR